MIDHFSPWRTDVNNLLLFSLIHFIVYLLQMKILFEDVTLYTFFYSVVPYCFASVACEFFRRRRSTKYYLQSNFFQHNKLLFNKKYINE